MILNKTQYTTFCREIQAPLFFRPWVLDALCEAGSWGVVGIEKAGRVVAALPYYQKQKGPFVYITMPPLSKFMGPLLHPGFQKPDWETTILKELIEQLPPTAHFDQLFHYDRANWLPFYWKGYKQQTRYSYVIEGLHDLDGVFRGFSSDYRNQKIKKADASLRLLTDLPLQALLEVVEKTFQRQAIKSPYSFKVLSRLDAAAKNNTSGQAFFAVDELGNLHAAAYLMWDDRSSYYLVAGDDPQYRSSGAAVWLVWQLIRFTSQTLQLPRFDFLGSMIEPIERVRRQFGAVQAPYFYVWKDHSWGFSAMQQVSSIFRQF